MYILGVETSCDDTGVSVLRASSESAPEVLSEVTSSQDNVHREYGGVVPELAAREHLHNLPILLNEVLEQSGLWLGDLSWIGVTAGPGLKGSLLTGFHFAQGLSVGSGVPMLGVNHIEGHIFSPFIGQQYTSIDFPFLAFVVSGGHTEIIIVEGLGHYQLWARTIDDAAGEAFDKSAHLLGFSYPGGAALAQEADEYGKLPFNQQKEPIELPRTMIRKKAFSFSGMKTAIALKIREQQQNGGIVGNNRAHLSYSIQAAIVRELVMKISEAMVDTGIRRIALSGGVAANRLLRSELELICDHLYLPASCHCTDNATMIAYLTGYHAYRRRPGVNEVFVRQPVEEFFPCDQ